MHVLFVFFVLGLFFGSMREIVGCMIRLVMLGVASLIILTLLAELGQR